MTQAAATPYTLYTGNGSQTVFPFAWRIDAAGDLAVYVSEMLTTAYTVTGVGAANGGTVVFTVAPATGASVFLVRTTPQTQLTDYIANDPFGAETHEAALDKLTRLIQDVGERLSRLPSLPQPTPLALRNLTLPLPGAGRLFGWNTDGTAIVLHPGGSQGTVGPPDAFLHATQYGAVGDGVTDDTVALQNAVDAAGMDGRILIINRGIYRLTSTLRVPYSNLSILGEATGYMFQSDPPTRGTVLKWDGALNGVMVDTGPAVPGPPYIVSGIRLDDLTLDCNFLAGTGLLVSSALNCAYRNLVIKAATQNSLLVTVRFGAVSGFSVTDHCEFANINIIASGTANGINLTGFTPNGYGSAFCHFTNCSVVHENGIAYGIFQGDDNYFINCSASRIGGGTGEAIFFGGTNDGSGRFACANMFLGFNGQGAIRAQGLAGWANPSLANFVLFTSMDNTITVTIDSGASLYYVDVGGYTAGTMPRMRLPGLEAAEFAVLPNDRTAVKLLGGTAGGGPFISTVGGTGVLPPIMGGPFQLASYAVGALPTLIAGMDGAIAYCNTLAGGREPVFWDGAGLVWRRFSDRTVAS